MATGKLERGMVKHNATMAASSGPSTGLSDTRRLMARQ